jgi:hypothetical protein
VIKEIIRSAVSIANGHKMDPGSAVPHQDRQLIETTALNFIQWDNPYEDAKFEGKRLRSQADFECPVVNRVEKEENEKEEENSAEKVQISGVHTPDEQKQEKQRQRYKERLGLVRCNFFIIQEVVFHDSCFLKPAARKPNHCRSTPPFRSHASR